MKKKLTYKLWIITTLIFVLNLAFIQKIIAQENVNQEINADAYVVVDSKTGEIILEKNKDKRHFPASITKIVTAIIAIEERDLNEMVTISEHAHNTIGTSLSLKVGDKISLRDLLYGIMLHSGNDGAVAIAEHISNNETEFAQKMTSFAKSIDANNTQFINASGLPNDNHFTTAYDMAVITQYAMKNETFREIVQHKQYNWESNLWREQLQEHEKVDAARLGMSWEGKPQIINHNLLLNLYPGATGIKNGFTHEARYTLVGSTEKNGSEIIAVLLKSKDSETAYKDMISLLDEGFLLNKEKANILLAKKEEELKSGNELSEKETPIIEKQNSPTKNQSNNNNFMLPLGIFSISIIILFIIKRKQKR